MKAQVTASLVLAVAALCAAAPTSVQWGEKRREVRREMREGAREVAQEGREMRREVRERW